MYEYYQRLLDERHLTTAEVCAATGIGQATISAWKNRNGMLGANYLLLLSKFFNMPVEYFITGEIIEWDRKTQEIYAIDYYTEDEKYLIECYRKADDLTKSMAQRLLIGEK